MRIGIDVGGTFTDLVALERWSGRIVTWKVPSTPHEPHRAVIAALGALLSRYDFVPELEFLGHSTTVATNALLGQLGLELPRVALVTTHGFRDVIEIGRQNRSEVYNLFVERPRPLVARGDRLTVRERIDYRGNVLVPLDEASVAQVCAELRERGVAAVAICLLHAYVNDAHERRLAEAIEIALPGVRVTRSSDVDPQYREYERCSTTVVNAVLAPIVERYLERLVDDLRATQMHAPLYVMRSDGGLAAAPQVLSRPAAIVESGPASGAIAAAALGRRIGVRHLLSFDMGGTTAKAGTILDGVAEVADEFEAAGTNAQRSRRQGQRLPGAVSVRRLGRSQRRRRHDRAARRRAASLRVGPLSAGADPGPACYGKSASRRPSPTRTSCSAGSIRGTCSAARFPIDASRAHAAVRTACAPLGGDVERNGRRDRRARR